MKWIGQHIYDQISRFRDDVYLEDISTGTIASGGNLGLDSNNKIVKATEASGDLTSIVAGTGLSGTSLTGPIPTLNVDAAQTQITSVGTLASLAVTSASDLGSAAMTLTNADIDQIALDINASNGDANIIDIGATTLTSGNAIFIDSKNARNEIFIDRDCNATGDQSHYGMIQLEGTKASITGSGDTHAMIGIKSTITDTATNVGTSNLINLDLSSNMTNDGGTTKLYGISNVITGASDDTIGFYSNVRDGNPDIKLVSSADVTDYFTIATGAVGATTLTTVDTTVGATAHFEIAADGNITLDAAGDIALECGGGDLTCDADTITFESSNADDPQFVIKNTTADAQGARLQMRKDRGAAMVDNDRIGEIDFVGENSEQVAQQYGKIIVQALEVDDTDEAGKMTFQVAESDGTTAHLTTGLLIEGADNLTDGEINVTVGAGAASVTTVAGTLTMGSTATIDNSGVWVGGVIPSAKLDSDTAHLTTTQTFTGAKTFDEDIVGETTVQKWIRNVSYVATQGTTETFIPMVGSADNTSVGNGSVGMLMPTAGKLLKVHLKTQRDHSGVTTTVTMYNLDADEAHTAGNFTSLGVQSATGPAAAAVGVFDFQSSLDSGTNAFTAGEMLAISITNDGAVSSSCKYFVTLVFELDWTSY